MRKMRENDIDNSSILVSIRCIAYNQEKYIRKCLEGIVMQKTNFRFEAIVHDDASTDGTAAVIQEYVKKYPDIIKAIYEKENQYSKHDGSISRIMANAISPNVKYIAYCEGDDYWIDPLKLQKQIDILETHSDVSLVYTGFRTVNTDGEPMVRPRYERYKQMSFSGDILPTLIGKGNFVMTLTVCIRKEIYDSKILINSKNGLDYLLFLVAASHGHAIFIPDETACYRYVASSAMNANFEKVKDSYIKAKIYFTKYFLDSYIQRYPFKKRLKYAWTILTNSVSFYHAKTNRKYLEVVLYKRRTMQLLLPAVLISMAFKKILRKN